MSDDAYDRTRLAEAADRLQDLSHAASWAVADLVEVFALYNEAAYVQFTIDSVRDKFERRDLDALCRRFFDDDELDVRLRDRVNSMVGLEGEVEAARREFLAQLNLETTPRAQRGMEEATVLIDSIARLDEARRTLLNRLGIDTALVSNPSTTMDSLLAATESANVRCKLARAWQLQAEACTEDISTNVDALVQSRGSQEIAASADQYEALHNFLEDSLHHAMRNHEELAAVMQQITGSEHSQLLVNFARGLQLLGVDAALRISVDDSLAHAAAVAGSVSDVFDLVEVNSGLFCGTIGTIRVEPWRTHDEPEGPAFTETLRNRMDWDRLRQLPVSRVRCRLQTSEDRTLSLQGASTLFHEFGHAVNHVLSSGRLPFTSGLFYLPALRRECMSMWFERRALDESFLVQAASGDIDLARRVRAAKALGDERVRLERVVAAYIDFELHTRPVRSIRSVYEELDVSHGIGKWCGLGEVGSHFASPRYTSRPGGAVAYIVGEAFSRSIAFPGDREDFPAAFAPLFDNDVAFRLPAVGVPDVRGILEGL